jgi:hypothetical protein
MNICLALERTCEPPALNYDELPGLEDVYLEDSFVREIIERSDSTSFSLMAALAPEHPDYESPARREAHRYRMATLTFAGVRARTWHVRTMEPFTDADGGVDYGNIDRFTADCNGFYLLEGEWGRVEIRSRSPELVILQREPREHRTFRKKYAAWIEGNALTVERRQARA